MPQRHISQHLIDLYAAGPSKTRAARVKTLHENIREALEIWGDKKFETFLQGSYRNDTAIADINDVDIVALYDPWSSPQSRTNWTWLFNHIADILRQTRLVSGTVKLGDKCVKLEGELKADIVPAISPSPYSSADPVLVYSRESYLERPNFPRTHRLNGVAKQKDTSDAYKATVRLFKRWVRQYPSLTAPSFYIECAVHSVPSSAFDTYLPLSFASVAQTICEYSRTTYVPSVARDKDILLPSEWDPDDFAAFQNKLVSDVGLVLAAIHASDQTSADRLWKAAFGD